MSADIMGRVIVDLLRVHAHEAASRFERYSNDQAGYCETQADMAKMDNAVRQGMGLR
jgi:hypothetical protein